MNTICVIILAALLNFAAASECNPTCYSNENCVEAANKTGCVCNTTLYKNKALSDFIPTLTCTGGIMEISLSQCLLDYFGLNSSTLRLTNTSNACYNTYPSVINSGRAQSLSVQAQTGLCGNRVTIDSVKVSYTNTLQINIQNKSLLTVNPVEMNFTCSYNLTMQISLNVTLKPIISITYLTGPNGEGSYPLTFAAYKNPDYTVPFEQADTVVVGTYIYLGLFITGADGDTFALRTVQCWATPTNNRNDPNAVVLVKDGCAVNEDVETLVEKNGESLESRIRISSFQFRDQNEVYVFCNTRLCEKSEGCTGCLSGKASKDGSGQVSISLKLDDYGFNSAGSHKVGFLTLLGCFLILLISSRLF
ncbi:pancreatic secretory granule membrane major glycoprotein GP2-like [Bombina bombina]|uniref:pancreatic secretory granule membrane major glycoprotein GP2-like n=1 Tax=Bombina bombina TaxID=8345 RepID=UPI00235A582A|nr:pancreatic secretory granule membrane major glycoprotein GP2-like [Bombina bombina]